ncbi:flagellar hook-basal body complex protein [Buchnera aphidicola (Thelaxes californica)]|uniref:Flagellar hook-basal body complex protein n=1 Tax=Buchnera aphidicola (Thelaxes californica) TaxID=1315998 RepID=A0A4D6Y9V3_9GAMM|nr:flagellar hook-basal body complex protein [Buchnera aphidicola]QCI26796.1 flagellar hook-basal body complex protein [Buchnera aphidicola (Thelaxes californica)]
MDITIYQIGQSINRLLDKQNVITNNIANASTPGFKEKFATILTKKQRYCDIQQGQKNFLVQNVHECINTSAGLLKNTERSLDLAISKKNYWFIVKKNNDKKEYYTRNGNIHINEKQQLNIAGNILIGINNKPIIIPENIKIDILKNGSIVCHMNKNDQNIIKNIGIIKIIHLKNHHMIPSKYGNLYTTNVINKKKSFFKKKKIKDIILSGFLEDSNVSLTDNMVNMISNARLFEMNIKLIQYYNDNEKIANKFMNINN